MDLFLKLIYLEPGAFDSPLERAVRHNATYAYLSKRLFVHTSFPRASQC